MIGKCLKSLLFLALMFGFTCPVQAADKVLINGIDANYPPFAYVDESGKPSGFDIEVVDWIADTMGFEVKHQPMAWDSIVTSLVNKKIDFVASGMSITPERAERVNFTNPYWQIVPVLIVKNDSSLTPEDLLRENKTIGTQAGTTVAEWLQENAGKNGYNYTLRLYDSFPLASEDVLNGRIDAAGMDDAPAKDISAKKPLKIVGPFGMHGEDFGYAVRKEDTELLDKLNKGLEKIKGTQFWQDLVKKYEL